jgi:HNH endonuclease
MTIPTKRAPIKEIDAAFIRSCLSYCPETGIFRWLISLSRRVRVGEIAGCADQSGWVVRIRGRGYLARRLAWVHVYGAIPHGAEVRTINRDVSDCRLANLELSSLDRRAKMHDGHRNSKLGVAGVSQRDRKGKTVFVARLRRDKRIVHHSRHTTLEAAIAAREAAVRAWAEADR